MSKILSFPLDDLNIIHPNTKNDLKHRYSIIYKDENGQNYFGVRFDKIVDNPKEKIKFKKKYRPFGLFLTISTSDRVEIELFGNGNTFDMKDSPDLRDLNSGEFIYFDITAKGIIFSREIKDKEVNEMYVRGLIDFVDVIQSLGGGGGGPVFEQRDFLDNNIFTFVPGGNGDFNQTYLVAKASPTNKPFIDLMNAIVVGTTHFEGSGKFKSLFSKDTNRLLELIKEKDDNIWTAPFTVTNNQNGLITVK